MRTWKAALLHSLEVLRTVLANSGVGLPYGQGL